MAHMKILDLNGPWLMRQSTDVEWIQAQVPGSVYADLLTAGKIEDPFYRDNEISIKELSHNDYEYTREFQASGELLQSDLVVLCCQGLDTLADISINNQPVATTDNMHRQYEFDIKHLLTEGNNSIDIGFKSPTKFIADKHGTRPLWNADVALAGMAHIRKAHYMFGWDWGPTLPNMGIWRDISIKGYQIARLTDVYVTQNHGEGKVTLDVRVRKEQWQNSDIDIDVKLVSPTGVESKQQIQAAEDEAHLFFTIDQPEIWWPNGFGEHPLYQVITTLLHEGQQLDQKSHTIGLRTMAVRQNKDEWGKEFAFEVNGIAIFSMGADYIPEDSILSRNNPEKTEKLIADCVAANFNSIRVWGGGIYPDDYFFDLCDEYGLIVWLDFMFACAVYEMTEPFAENIRREVEDNAKRIRHHASLGLWCGNNEMEWGWMEWGLPPDEKLKKDYLIQFEELIPEVLQETDPNTFYWPASPSSGGGFDKPNDENFGDFHDWMVWHGRQPFTYFRSHYYRFLSEFGLQSFPSLKTIESFTLPEDRNIFSRVMEHHQKNGTGNQTILYYIAETFKYPKSLDALSYASQLVQAEGMKCAVEHMRRHRGRCMGSIYWQLNDCWPVASWSGIDSFGRWKALHYFARRFYQPVLLSACETGSSATLHLSNETLESVTGILTWRLRDKQSVTLQEGNKEVSIPALSAAQYEALEFKELETDPVKQRSVYLEVSFLVDGTVISADAVLFSKPKTFEFIDPGISSQVEKAGNGFNISLTSQAFAKYVEIRFDELDVVLSDNFFYLSAGEPKIIHLQGDQLSENITVETLEKQISVRSIYDIEERATTDFRQ